MQTGLLSSPQLKLEFGLRHQHFHSTERLATSLTRFAHELRLDRIVDEIVDAARSV
jgi:hypothetical protein